jgi:hypothetical protein
MVPTQKGNNETQSLQFDKERIQNNTNSENITEKLRIKVKKNDFVVWIKLTPIQIELYSKFITIPEIKEVMNHSII